MTTGHSIRDTINRDGYAVVERVLSDPEISCLIAALTNQSNSAAAALEKRGSAFALRNLLEIPEIADLANSTSIHALVRLALGGVCFPVRGILFDKIPEANWKVPWHQDVTIAVREKIETSGFGPWSTKAGVLNVQPPASVLEKMISIRLHLDPCDESNGALRVVPGSHRCGRIPEREIPRLLAETGERVCAVPRGGALLIRPLLLHASSPSLNPGHRRVIHLDFAGEPLPGQLQWFADH